MPATPQLLTVDPGGVTAIVDISDSYGTSITAYTASGGGTSHTLPLSISTPTAFWLTTGGTFTVSAKIGQAEIAGGTVEVGSGIPATYTVQPVTAGHLVAAFAQVAPTINAQVGVAYTLAVTDAGKIVTLSNADPIELTAPKNATAAIPIGSSVTLVQTGVGQVTVAAEATATVDKAAATLKFTARYSVVTLTKVSTSGWVASGDLAAS